MNWLNIYECFLINYFQAHNAKYINIFPKIFCFIQKILQIQSLGVFGLKQLQLKDTWSQIELFCIISIVCFEIIDQKKGTGNGTWNILYTKNTLGIEYIR